MERGEGVKKADYLLSLLSLSRSFAPHFVYRTNDKVIASAFEIGVTRQVSRIGYIYK